jgi:type II secretory pathway component PulK
MTIQVKSTRGIALVTTLCVSTVLLVLGLAFLSFLERDYRFAATQSRNQEAFYLALSGIEYAKSRPDLVTKGAAAVSRNVPLGNPSRYFSVQVLADGSVQSIGTVQSGLVKIEKTLIVRPGDSPRRFVETGL